MADGLDLNDAELAHLQSLGVRRGDDGVFRSEAGREVSPGTAVKMLSLDGSLRPTVSTSEYRANLAALGKGMDPGRFHRGYLTPGHQADSPAVTGHQTPAPMPESRPAEPQDFTRSFLRAGHQKPSPDDGVNNLVPPGSDGRTLYDSASAAYNANRERSTNDHVECTGTVSSRPAVPQWRPSPDLGSGNVPTSITVAATRPAPGERQ